MWLFIVTGDYLLSFATPIVKQNKTYPIVSPPPHNKNKSYSKILYHPISQCDAHSLFWIYHYKFTIKLIPDLSVSHTIHVFTKRM